MRSRRIIAASFLALLTTVPAFAYNHAHRGPTSQGLFKHRGSKSSPRPTGPRAIEPQRATEIQEAMIRQGYMTGTPSGHWDSDSQVAMQKLQASKGWQTKLTPDSRALILLGLGPQQTGNAETSQIPGTISQHSDAATPTANLRPSLALVSMN
jgi:hypothetical protein